MSQIVFIRLFVIFGAVKLIISSFCGESSLPYYIKISSKNEIILGCAKPTCFNFPSGATSHFTDLEDGFSDGFISVPKSSPNSFNVSENIECDRQFGETSCNNEGDWIGGIHPRSFNNEKLVFRCCRNSVMKNAKFHQVFDLATNDEFRNGGDVYAQGKLIIFDYISNIIKFEADQGTLYEVFVNRIFCKKSATTGTVEQHQKRISNTADIFIKAVNDESPAKKYLADQKSKLFQVPLIETQNVNNVNELQNFNINNEIQPQEPGAVAQQPNFGDGGAGGAGACSTCTSVQVVTGTQLGIDLPITQTVALDTGGCTVITVTCSSANPNEPITLYWAGDGVNRGRTIGTGSVTEILSCTNAGQLLLNEQSAGIVDQAACVSTAPPPLQPVPAAPYYPVASGGGLLNYLCFSADTLVTTVEGNKKRMDELKLNDLILSGNSQNGGIGYSKVLSWIHKKPNLMAEFIKFTLENGQHLKITKKHYIYKGDCKSNENTASFKGFQKVFAENVSIHDCLFALNNRNELTEFRISKTELVKEKGIYAPLTRSGNIIVNDIFASCYSNIDLKPLQSSLSSFTEIVKYVTSSFKFGHSPSSSSSNEYDLMPGFKYFMNILKDILPHDY